MEKRSHHQFITLGGTAQRPKYTTRHLAALDFLLNIPMQKETSIRLAGLEIARKQRMEETEGLDTNVPREDEEDTQRGGHLSPTVHLQPDDFLASQSEAAGKKLQGPMAAVGKYPHHLRYYMQKTSVQSALYRQWEDTLLDKVPVSHFDNHAVRNPSVLDSRVFISRARSYPTMVFSIIQFDAKEEKARQEKLRGDDQKALKVYELPHRDWRGFSYKPLFKPLNEELTNAGGTSILYNNGFLYDPNILDDPDLLYGSHRYVLQKAVNTGPIISSIILYVNKKDLKESLNEKFHEKHPHLPPSLTLSKIRKLKKDLVSFAMKNEIELSTIAIAIINFERLCLKSLVNKINRRLSMAVCLLLAIKFHEIYTIQKSKKILEILFDYYDKEWSLTKKSIIEAEFGVYVHLGFLLHIPHQHIYLVYLRLLKLVNKNNQSYLKDDMLDMYVKDVKFIERMNSEMMLHSLKNANEEEEMGGGDDKENNGENTVLKE
jgi:hypothetical protein